MFTLFAFTQWLLLAIASSAIAGLVKWNTWKQTYIKWFIVYLCIITMAVAAGNTLIYFKRFSDFGLLNNCVVVFEMLFIHWYFLRTLNDSKRKWVLAGGLFYLSSLVFEVFDFSEKDYYFQSISYTVGNLFILVYLILFFIEFVNSEKIMHYKKEVTFWIAAGILIFYLGTFPFYGLYNELLKNMNLFAPLAWVATGLNYSMYILFSIGLLWGKQD